MGKYNNISEQRPFLLSHEKVSTRDIYPLTKMSESTNLNEIYILLDKWKYLICDFGSSTLDLTLGIRISIVGQSSKGKSSLINALLSTDKNCRNELEPLDFTILKDDDCKFNEILITRNESNIYTLDNRKIFCDKIYDMSILIDTIKNNNISNLSNPILSNFICDRKNILSLYDNFIMNNNLKEEQKVISIFDNKTNEEEFYRCFSIYYLHNNKKNYLRNDICLYVFSKKGCNTLNIIYDTYSKYNKRTFLNPVLDSGTKGLEENITKSDFDECLINKKDNMNTIKVIISYSDKNYFARIIELPGYIITGDSIEEIIKEINISIKKYIKISRELNWTIPNIFNSEYELEYEYTIEALLNKYSNIFTKSALAKITGINERQLWYYASGVRKPRKKQIDRINDGLKRLASELLSVNICL